jgi:hypothetical protein
MGYMPGMAIVIWDRPENPPKSVSDLLGIPRWKLGDALHEIKGPSDLGGADRVIIYDDGSVTDQSGEHLGNIYDEL